MLPHPTLPQGVEFAHACRAKRHRRRVAAAARLPVSVGGVSPKEEAPGRSLAGVAHAAATLQAAVGVRASAATTFATANL